MAIQCVDRLDGEGYPEYFVRAIEIAQETGKACVVLLPNGVHEDVYSSTTLGVLMDAYYLSLFLK